MPLNKITAICIMTPLAFPGMIAGFVWTCFRAGWAAGEKWPALWANKVD